MKIKLLILLLFPTILICQQKKEHFLYGKVIDNIRPVVNAHIINTTNNLGTYTNENGEFKIKATINDSLQISSIGYETKIHIVRNLDLSLKNNNFKLKKTIYKLDDVFIKKHNLIGSIDIDTKNVPNDRVNGLMNKLLNGIVSIDISNVNRNMDVVDRMKAPVLNSIPPNFFRGITVFNSKWLSKNKKQVTTKKINSLEKKVQLPIKIIRQFGKKTFINEFKIPENKIHQFIDYCSHRNLESLFHQKKLIKVIEIFQEESPKFLKSINN